MMFYQRTTIHAFASPAINSSQTSSRCLSDEEQKLAHLIYDYRDKYGLAPTSITHSLTQVAKVHVRDLHEHFLVTVPPSLGLGCNLHSWSSQGHWTPVCYRPDHALAAAMWKALVPCDAIRPTEPSFWTFLLEKVMILAHGTSFSAEDQHDIDTHALYRLWV